MSSATEKLKRLALKVLPEAVLFPARKYHHLRVITDFQIEDEPELELVSRLVQPGQTVLDVGANIGVYSKFLSQFVGASGAVYSFEPIPTTYKILANNISKLRLLNVVPYNFAATSLAGEMTMVVPKWDSGGENFYQARLVLDDSSAGYSRKVLVKTTTLDLIWDKLSNPHVSFVKIDVEGAELECLRGAQRLLKACEPALLVEVSGNLDAESNVGGRTNSSNGSAVLLNQLLTKLGYSVFVYDKSELRVRRAGESFVNYVFLKDSHLEILGVPSLKFASNI